MKIFKSSDAFIGHHRREILIWNYNKKPWKGFKKGLKEQRTHCSHGLPQPMHGWAVAKGFPSRSASPGELNCACLKHAYLPQT